MEYVFGNDDLRRYIFSFLRKHPQKTCDECHKILIWDKKVNKYIDTEENIYFNLKNTSYCNDCYFHKLDTVCIIL